jgi:MarR family transcriptional regulator for hemolysin
MSDSATDGAAGGVFGDPVRLWGNGTAPRPSLGEIGLLQFAPYLINRISLSWTTHLADALKAHEMTTTKMRALYALTEQSTMSRTLDSLEEQDYIRRRPRAEDLRVRDVELTQRGRDAFAKVWPMMYDLLLKMLEGIDNEEYKAFTATLHKMIQNIRRHDI